MIKADVIKQLNMKLREIHTDQSVISKKRAEIRKKMLEDPANSKDYAKEINSLDLSYDAKGKALSAYKAYINDLMNVQNEYANLLARRKAADNEAKKAKLEAKCLKIARKIANGVKVSSEERNLLMQYDPELYRLAEELAMMVKHNKENQDETESMSDEIKQYGTVTAETSAGADMGEIAAEGMTGGGQL